MTSYFAVFGGYGDQYWTSLMEPNFRGKGNGLTVCAVDGKTGGMSPVRRLDGIMSPATLVVSPDQRYLYAANETNSFGGQGFGGGVSAFRIDPDSGELHPINQSSAFGSCTAYVTLDRTGRYLLAANHGSYYFISRYAKDKDGTLYPSPQYDEGCVCLFEIREDGGIGKLLDRVVLEGTGADPLMHASSHPHSVLVSEEDDVIIPNKGGDNLYFGRLDREAGKIRILSVFGTGKGSSPRHAFFCTGTSYVLVQNEFDGCLCSYRMDRAEGRLHPVDRIDAFPPEPGDHQSEIASFAHPWGCDVQMHPNGKLVYSDSSSANKIALFAFDRETGRLRFLRHYATGAKGMIRGMQIDRDGKWLTVTCVNEDRALIYAIDEKTGELKEAGEVSVPTPTALRFVYPTGGNV